MSQRFFKGILPGGRVSSTGFFGRTLLAGNSLASPAIRCHTVRVNNTIETQDDTETRPLSKVQEARVKHQESEIKQGKEALAKALSRSLVLLRYRGKCTCGLMLTDRDKNPKADTYRCPHCERSGPLAPMEHT